MSVSAELMRRQRAWVDARMADAILYGDRADCLPGILSPLVPAVSSFAPFKSTDSMWDVHGHLIQDERYYLGGPALVDDGWHMELLVTTSPMRIAHVWWVSGRSNHPRTGDASASGPRRGVGPVG